MVGRLRRLAVVVAQWGRGFPNLALISSVFACSDDDLSSCKQQIL